MCFLVGFAFTVLSFRFYKKIVLMAIWNIKRSIRVSSRWRNHSWASDTLAFVPHTTFDKPLRFHICLTLKSDLVLVYNLIGLKNFLQKLTTSKSQNILNQCFSNQTVSNLYPKYISKPFWHFTVISHQLMCKNHWKKYSKLIGTLNRVKAYES